MTKFDGMVANQHPDHFNPLESKESGAEPPVRIWNQAGGRDDKLFTDGWNACRDRVVSRTTPQPCLKCVEEKEYSASVFKDYQRVCREIEMMRREPCPKRLTKEQVIEAALNCNTSNIADVDRGEPYRISAPQGEVK